MLYPYFTLRVPYDADATHSPWRPQLDDVGTPFEVRSCGCFKSVAEACIWAAGRLVTPNYSIVFVDHMGTEVELT